jgi:hypothetical protein
MLAGSAYGGTAWATFTHDHADIHGSFSYFPGLTTDPTAPGWVSLVSLGTMGNGPPSNSLSLPQISQTISGVTFAGSGQGAYFTTPSLTQSDASFSLSVDGSSTVTAYADVFDNHVFSIERAAPLGFDDLNSYYHYASYNVVGHASAGDTIVLYADVWCDAQPVYPSGDTFLSPTGSIYNGFEFTVPLATVVGTGDFHYGSPVIFSDLFNLGTDLGTGINTQGWITGENFIHIGALIEHDGSSGRSWVNFDPTVGTPSPVPEPAALAMVSTVATVLLVFRRWKSGAARRK